MSIIVTIVATTAVNAAAVFAFGRTVFLKWLDARYAKADAVVRGRIEHAVYRSKVQSDAEFLVLRELWPRVARVRGTMLAVRPSSRLVPDDETEQEAKDAFFERRRVFQSAFNEMKIAILDAEPFISPPVFAACDRLLRTCQLEDLQLRTNKELFTSGWWSQGQRNAEDVKAQVADVSSEIRRHLGNVVIIG